MGFRSAAPGGVTAAAHAAFAKASARFPALAVKAKNAGDIADFTLWQRRTFGRVEVHPKREALWQGLTELMWDDEWTVIELGVAWGYATSWFLERTGNPDVTWHGFDRFTGLPTAWREYDSGHFDAAGKPPDIADPRVHWHVGDLEDTLPALDIPASGQRLVLFDLDLYAPTAFAWRHLSPHLRRGDQLWFDEAMDDDERRVLDEMVLPTGDLDYLGASPAGLLLRIR